MYAASGRIVESISCIGTPVIHDPSTSWWCLSLLPRPPCVMGKYCKYVGSLYFMPAGAAPTTRNAWMARCAHWAHPCPSSVACIPQVRPPPNVNPCQLIFAFPVALSSSSTRALCVFYAARRRRGRGEVEGLPFSGWWGALLSRPAIPDLIGFLLYFATPTLWRPHTRKTGILGLGMGDEAPRVTQDKPQLNAALTR